MARFRLRTAMLIVAALAVLLGSVLGLRRRANRLWVRGIEYATEAEAIEEHWLASPPPGGEHDELMERIHRLDAIASSYLAASRRPWVPGEPDPQRISCRCSAHQPPAPGSGR